MNTAIAPMGFVRVSRANPCPACGKPDYCTRSVDGLLIKCMRTPSQRAINQKDGVVAYLHLAADLNAAVVVSTKIPKRRPKLRPSEIASMLKKHKTALSARRLTETSKSLGISERSLLLYGIGYDAETDCVSAPMYDGQRRPVGIHLRDRGGKKKCVVGSRNGLFIPSDYDASPLPFVDDGCAGYVLLTPEGLTDCCAAKDAGFCAVGRPSNAGGREDLATLLAAGPAKQLVVVCSDRDNTKFRPDGTPYWPGIEGALLLLERLIKQDITARLQFLIPPEGAGKDLREWLTNDKRATPLLGAVVSAPVVTPGWLRTARQKLEGRRRKERKTV